MEFVVDAEADAFDALGRKPTSLAPVLASSRALALRGAAVRWVIPLQPALLHRLEGLFSLARDERVDPVLVPAAAVGVDAPDPSPEQARFAWDFVRYRLLEEERDLLSPERLAFYERLRDRLAGGARDLPRAPRTVASLEEAHGGGAPHWSFSHESGPGFGEATRGGVRPAGALGGSPVSAQAAELGEVLRDAGLALSQWTRTPGPAASHSPGQLATVLVIGAYGGEHIGDAAILGGVLFRLHRRYGTTRAVLLSQRPDHTRHLLPMLDTPVEVSVEAHEQRVSRAQLPRMDAVVFAGGPLMDLPKQLVQHLYTVSLARRRGLPFIVEGIGAGPFKRRPSEWTARRLVRMADRITVRTSDDAATRLLEGLAPTIDRDPAFDYLETRGAELTRLPERDRRAVDTLLEDTEGRLTVGLNLRPIRHLFTEGTSARRRVERTRFVEARFEERLAEAMGRVKHASSKPPCFVFFPMNAIQSGQSDLRSAYRVKRLLRGDVDLRVWQGDPSIDGVVALLRRLDAVVAMRFHANIFALSQGRPVIGIDYRPGARDKVAALLDDFGRGESLRRIDELTADWLFERLSELGR